MSNININTIYALIKLNYNEVKITGFKEDFGIYIFSIKWKNKHVLCPKCWIKNNKRKDLVNYTWKQNLKHIWMSCKQMIELNVTRRYFRCKNCKSCYMEYFSFDTISWLHTFEFQQFVIYWRWHMSWLQIAKDTKCSASKIHQILKKINPLQINKDWLDLMNKLEKIYLGIDEHSFKWKDMILVIVELKEKKPIAVLENTKVETIENWIKSLPENIKKKIVWISTDMNKWYKNIFERQIPKILSTVDKYHLVQEANRMVDEVRQLNVRLLQTKIVKPDEKIKYWKIPKKVLQTKENKELTEKLKSNKYKPKENNILQEKDILPQDLKNWEWEIIEYKEITLDYFLNTGYRKLFMKKESNLSWIQKLRLRQVFKEFDYKWYMAEAWVAKERLIDALDTLNIIEIVDIMKDCITSEHYRIRAFWRTLKRWMKQLETYCKHSTKEFKFTNAYTESFNWDCKVQKRVSRWFRHKSNYFRKLCARNSFKYNSVNISHFP